MKKLIVLLCSASIISFALPVLAADAQPTPTAAPTSGPTAAPAAHKPRDPKINKRQHKQKNRVKEGVKSGELTKEEAQGLRQERRDIRAKEAEYKSDGKMTKEERKDVKTDLNQASKNINEQKHDADKRPKAQ